MRQNLSALRKQIKAEGEAGRVRTFVQDNQEVFLGFLHSEDPKTRKNAALLFGDLGYQSAAGALFDCYEKEETLFVRSAYLQALDQLDASAFIPALEQTLQKRLSEQAAPEHKGHMEEEIRALRKLLIPYLGIQRHTFVMTGKMHKLLLTTNTLHRKFVCSRFKSARVHPLGVLVETDSLQELSGVRCYREILFIHGEDTLLSPEPVEAAQILAPWMQALCHRYHREDGSFYFRVECKGRMTLEERSRFTKRLGAEMEEASGGALINSVHDYEVELRLIENKEGKLFPCLKFFTLKDHRFAYRRHAIATSIHPSEAALIVELAKPYLKENAQILDPFCGVGTMLIERSKAVPAKEIYATDIYGEAIAFGRENAREAGVDIHFIQRDFFDFKHSYLFDEIITNMPVRGKRTKEETDELYRRFFDKAVCHMKDNGVILLYTGEIAFIKKQLRLHREYHLLQETLMNKKSGFSLFILGVKG